MLNVLYNYVYYSHIINSESSLDDSQLEFCHPQDNIITRVSHSALAKSHLLKGGIGLFSLASLFSVLSGSSVIQTVAFSAFAYLSYEKHRSYSQKYRKEIMEENKLMTNILVHLEKPHSCQWFTEIIPDKLILGGLPFANFHHQQQLENMGVTHLLSLVEEEEFKSKIFVPLKPKESENWKMINVANYESVTVDQLREAVDWLEDKIQEGKKVLVHCRSGKGRSAMVVLIFLAIHGHCHDSHLRGMSKELDEMDAREKVKYFLEYLKKLRPQVKPNSKQQETLIEYLNSEENRLSFHLVNE